MRLRERERANRGQEGEFDIEREGLMKCVNNGRGLVLIMEQC